MFLYFLPLGWCVNGRPLGRFVVPADQNGLEAITLEGGDERSRDVETRATGYGGSSCLGGTMCVPMSECTSMYYEVAKSCYNGDRSMYCGGTQYEPYICCPKSPLDHSNVCGKTLVAGQFYRGLGAFPFVARIGFRSKFFLNLFFLCIDFNISKIINIQSEATRATILRRQKKLLHILSKEILGKKIMLL